MRRGRDASREFGEQAGEGHRHLRRGARQLAETILLESLGGSILEGRPGALMPLGDLDMGEQRLSSHRHRGVTGIGVAVARITPPHAQP